MPLKHDASEASLKYNIAEMIKAGHKPDQAAAAAYRIQREYKKQGKKGK